jgi:glutamyl-tRNA synthetase
MVRTRFAPSPTGYLHLGGARTALFSWAYARKHGGKFILRIEDTDLERSTEESVQAIIDGMQWLGLTWDEGPFRQMHRLARYREIADQLIRQGDAYPCYCSRDELTAMRDAQRLRGEKPRYDGTWRPENAKGKTPPAGVEPVLRFRNPQEGAVTFTDLVKGDITIANAEIDDLVILRADGVPTYNFGVVVDDLDMNITHVIRGDDHVNNTPRQVNIFKALGATLPHFAHVPMILGPDGERLSKRHGAVSVMQYPEDGFLPEAMVNYLARLGWSHGNEEIFSLAQFVEWFDLAHISRSPAQFDPEKLAWLNQHYLKGVNLQRIAGDLRERIRRKGGNPEAGPDVNAAAALFLDRAHTIDALAGAMLMFYREPEMDAALVEQHIVAAIRPALADVAQGLAAMTDWRADGIPPVIDGVLKKHNLKMPKLAVPLRVAVFGVVQTPALAAVLALAGRERILERLACYR